MKLMKVVAAVLVLGLPAQAMAAFFYNGHTYFLTSTALSWTSAEAEANSTGDNLVAINDAAENAFLVSAFGGLPDRFWIGLNDAASEGSFVWSNGDAVTYTNWAGGEPNNAGGEDYTVINWSTNGDWNDCPNTGCGASIGIIESVSEPASLGLIGLGLLGIAALRRRSRTAI